MRDEAIEAIERVAKEDTAISESLYSYLPLTKLGVYDSLQDDPWFWEIVKREKEIYEMRLKKYSLPID